MRTRNENTRQKIIAAARQLFLERGYVATSMEAIATQAVVTKQTLYGYFSDKRALFMCIIEDIMGGSSEPRIAASTVCTPDDLRKALYQLGAHINGVIAEPDYIQLLRVVIAESISEPGLGKLFERGVTVRALRSFTTLFGAAQKNGLIAIEHSAIAAQFFIGGFLARIFLQGLLMQSGKKYIRKQTRAELLRYIDEFMRLASTG
ncbi:MAG TPA: TetR/AcrR family transcriptional regulator [Candidatus Saccharimonadales bacterium]|nr:TetR/AcrR family transcriptional regulator [Candidatus Saccharimonadales bacterium]